jgi:hypothetical protein
VALADLADLAGLADLEGCNKQSLRAGAGTDGRLIINCPPRINCLDFGSQPLNVVLRSADPFESECWSVSWEFECYF